MPIEKKDKEEEKEELIIDVEETKQEPTIVADKEDKGEPEEKPEKKASDIDFDEEEIKQYSKNVQTRIGKLTSRYHTEKRQREALAQEVEEQGKIARAAIDELNRLKDLVNRGEHVMLGEARGRIESEIKVAQSNLKAALDLGESDKIAQAQADLSRVMAQRERIAGYQPQALQKTHIPQRQVVDTRAQDWAKGNTWFGRDQEMTHFAMGLHKRLTEIDGIRPDSDEYYDEIDANVRKRFPDRMPRTNGRDHDTASRNSAVASVSRASGKPRRVTLTESQVRIAKRLGLTNEQYASELLKSG